MNELSVDGIPPPVRVRVNRRAKRLSVKVRAPEGTVELVLPAQNALNDGIVFLRDQTDWIARRRACLPALVPFAPGAVIPFRDQPHLLSHEPGGRGVVARETPEDGRAALRVRGAETHFARRLTDWLKARAREDLSAAADHFAALADVKRGKISIRDTRGQWGSCSARGTLSFSWRLILAPPAVASYVAAHEVAHLRQRNHSPEFWRLVATLCPDHAAQRRWLSDHGTGLHRYGPG